MTHAEPPAPPGRRAPPSGPAQRPEVTAALTRALMEEWARTGYAALSLEAVARRAGVGKAALYRRWPCKLAMVSEALASDGFAALSLSERPLADRGSLAADLEGAMRELRRLLRHPLVRRILPDLHAEMPRQPELARLMRERVQAPRRALLAELFRRAVIRRELPTTLDVEAAIDLVVAPIYWRLVVTGGRSDDTWLDAQVRVVTRALAARGP